MKKTTPMSKIFDAYCKRLGIDAKKIRFMFDGKRITEEETPKMLELGDGDQIDAMIEQFGGA